MFCFNTTRGRHNENEIRGFPDLGREIKYLHICVFCNQSFVIQWFPLFFFIIFNQNLGKQPLDRFISPYKVHTKSPSSGRWLNDGSLNVFEILVHFSTVISKKQREMTKSLRILD